MYFDQATLRPYLEQGLISEQRHPLDENIRIYNYTHKVQHDPHLWDKVTKNCRGLVLDVGREVVVSACLRKFYNYEEHIQNGWGFPNEKPVITTKYDGWYGSLLWLGDEPWIATRGSFTSPGAEWATKEFRHIFRAMSPGARNYWRNPHVTHIFEIIAPITRIVVQYGFEGLVHLATVNKNTDESFWPLHTPPGILSVSEIAAEDYAALKDLNTENEEGFVIFFPQAQMRLKIKFADYVRRHRIYTGLSVHAIWEMFRDGMTLDDVSRDVPEEFAPWITKQYCRFVDAMTLIEVEANDTYADIMRYQLSRSWGKDMTARQKEIAMKFQEHGEMAPLLFQIHKQREMIYKAIEPSGSETFRRESEG